MSTPELEEEFSDQGVFVADLRDPVVLSTYPFLVPIRQAVTCAFDFMVEGMSHREVQPSIDDIPNRDLILLAQTLGLAASSNLDETPDAILALTRHDLETTYGDALQDIYWLHKAARGECDVSCRAVSLFLTHYYESQYDTHIFRTHTPLYFAHLHVVAITQHKDTGWCVGVSPANLFNDYGIGNAVNTFSLPRYQGRAFQRTTQVLLSDSQSSILAAFQKIEGGRSREERGPDWQWPPISFPYSDLFGKPAHMRLETFIAKWRDEDI